MNHPGDSRQDNFDAARLLAALVVLYGHAYFLTGLPAMPGTSGNEVATLAVKVFFAISGYLVSGSWLRDPSPSRYLQRRGLRIFPGLAVNTLLCALVLGPLVTTLALHDYLGSRVLLRYLANIVLLPAAPLPGVFANLPFPHTVNGSLWTLPVEFLMYLVVPFVLLGGARLARWRVLLAALALMAVSLYVDRVAPPAAGPRAQFLRDALNVAPYFLIGTLWRVFPGAARRLNPQVALLACALLVALPANVLVFEIALYAVLPYTVLSFALARPAVLGRVGRFGDLSYGVYIYAFPVQQTVALLFGTAGGPLVNTALSLVPTLVLAALSWHLVEKRCLRLKPRGGRVAPELAANAAAAGAMQDVALAKGK